MYQLKELAFDRFGAASIVTALQEKYIAVAEFGQGYVSMSAPTEEIERLVVSKKLVHPQNPVLTWCMSNVVVQMDPAGNVKPDRERSGEQIDGVVAMAMAGREDTREAARAVPRHPGVLTTGAAGTAGRSQL